MFAVNRKIMTDNFIAIDFETANKYRSSACSIGVVIVNNGKITKEWSSFIKPEPFFFSYWSTAIHGITPDMVAEAPVFEDIWSQIDSWFISCDAIVAHNAPFDMGVLHACLERAQIASYLPDSICTYRLARKKLPFLRNHKLNTVSEYFQIPLNHHDALSDARATAELMLRLSEI